MFGPLKRIKFGLWGLIPILCFVSSCGNPLGSVQTDKNFAPGYTPPPSSDNPHTAPVLLEATVSFAASDNVSVDTSDPNAPQMVAVAGLPADYNRRAGQTPAFVTRSNDSEIAIDPDATSDCGINCTVKHLYFGVMSYLHGN